ncbi:PilZ domain-containing protein [Sphingomonas adhaesiva]|uniref:PilZ domain-containing protein n=1 Tax=Sphingomonas adhaesiva TaxID=28212 RepID=UPI002FFB81F1
MALVATLYSDDARGAERRQVELDGTLRGPAHTPHDVLVSELSANGFRVPVTGALSVGARITLGLNGVGARAARIVRRAGEDQYGCEFVSPLTPGELAAALNAEPAELIRFPQTAMVVPADALPEPDVGRFPGPVRLAILMGGGLIAWGATIAAAIALF